jgi:hypothetical protein
MVSFKATLEDSAKLQRIAERASAILGSDRLGVKMDLTACHLNGCPLDLDKLLAAPIADFGHDVNGIARYIDRDTGQLTKHFVPKCAAPA